MMKTKETTYVRRLRVGDVFWDENMLWEVTRHPETESGDSVLIYIRHIEGKRAQVFRYGIDARVKLA